MKNFYLTYLHPSFKSNKGFREVVLFLSFLVFYKISRFIAIGDAQTAFDNAYALVDFEKWLGIFGEISVQQFFIGHTDLVKFLNKFYMLVHIPSTVVFFMWLYHKRSSHYKFIRNGFLIANSLTIFFYIGYPCAPPRMLNDLGFIDTLLKVSDVNLYTGMFSGMFNQYAAVPSMHFGNSFLIGIGVFLLSKNILTKIFIVAYPVFVLLVIVATGNHFFLDAIIGGLIVVAPFPFMLMRCKIVKVFKYIFDKEEVEAIEIRPVSSNYSTATVSVGEKSGTHSNKFCL